MSQGSSQQEGSHRVLADCMPATYSSPELYHANMTESAHMYNTDIGMCILVPKLPCAYFIAFFSLLFFALGKQTLCTLFRI